MATYYTNQESSGVVVSSDVLDSIDNNHNTSFAGALHAHSERVIQGTPLFLEVSRDNLFSQVVSFYKTASNSQLSRPLRVQFEGEDGIDAGGVRREFFQQFFMSVSAPEKGLFEGHPRQLWPVHNVMAVRTRVFRLLGTVLAHSITQCGMGMPCLAPGLFRFLLNENEEDAVVEMSLQGMPESDTKFMLIEVMFIVEACFL